MAHRIRTKLHAFDLDGTLIDSSDCVAASFAQAIAGQGLPPVDRERIVHSMGLSLATAFEHLVGEAATDDGLRDTLMVDYRKAYAALLPIKTKIIPGMKEVLTGLVERGGIVSVATSKRTDFARQSCEVAGIDDCIALYVGDDMVERSKPDPEMLELILAKMGIDRSEAVMIGDATTDIVMGRAASVGTIAVTWGAHSEEELRAAVPTLLARTPSELLHYLDGGPSLV